MNKINDKDVFIRQYQQFDDFTSLDLTDNDNSDPLNIQDFFHTRAINYQNDNLCSIWSVLYKDKLVGCFTLNMHAIPKKKLAESEILFMYLI